MELTDICPVSNTLKIIGKKWTINIINDLLFGKSRFSEFLEDKPSLSSKVLSARLKELENNGVISKTVKSVTPIILEYKLTEKGRHLNRINFEIAMYSALFEPEKIFVDPEIPLSDIIRSFGKKYHFNQKEIELYLEMFSQLPITQEVPF